MIRWVLGGLIGDGIPPVLDRVTGRLRAQPTAAAKLPAQRVVAVVLCSCPAGAGAGGTAALLDVPRLLEAVLGRLAADDNDFGDALTRGGDDLVAAAAAADTVGTAAGGGVSWAAAAAAVAGACRLVTPATRRQLARVCHAPCASLPRGATTPPRGRCRAP